MPRAFLLMPFRPEFAELHRVIVEAGTQVGVEVVRADDIFAGGVVVDQVRRQIYEADAVIAVCTDRNPNVFFELGLADPAHRPILVAKARDDLPFDIQHWRAQFYGGDTPANNLETLGMRIQRALTETLAEPRPVALAAGNVSAQRLSALRSRVSERARELLGAMATYAPGDLSKFGGELEPLLLDYYIALTSIAQRDEIDTLEGEVRDFARWTELDLGPRDGYSSWIQMPQWLVWWMANACGMYAVFTQRWAAIYVLSQQSCYVASGSYRPLTLLDPGDGGIGIGSARLTSQMEQQTLGRDAAATALVRTLARAPAVQSKLGDFASSEEALWRLLAVYRYLSVLRAIEDERDMPEWPWLYSIGRLDRFVRRVNQDRAYRGRLAERLFGRTVEGFEAEAPRWAQKVFVPVHAETRAPTFGPFT